MLRIDFKHAFANLLFFRSNSKAWFPPGDKSRFYRQIGDKSKVIA